MRKIEGSSVGTGCVRRFVGRDRLSVRGLVGRDRLCKGSSVGTGCVGEKIRLRKIEGQNKRRRTLASLAPLKQTVRVDYTKAILSPFLRVTMAFL